MLGGWPAFQFVLPENVIRLPVIIIRASNPLTTGFHVVQSA